MLIIGIDGASPKVAGPMLKEGRLPNLARIAEQGVSGRLRSVLPLYSPRIWTTIATGRKPADHGIIAFVKKSDSDDKQLYLSDDRKVPALWNILSSQGRSVGVVNWWTTFPLEKIDGVMVSDHFFPEQVQMIKQTFKDARETSGALVYPESWSERAEALIADRSPVTEIANPFAGTITLPHWANIRFLTEQFETDGDITRVTRGLSADFDLDVTMVLLPGLDRVSHWLWGNLEPAHLYPEALQPNAEERVGGAEALRVYYEYVDRLVGLLSTDYGPDDLVIVMSDHGFEAGRGMGLLSGVHESEAAIDGVFFAAGAGIRPGAPVGELGMADLTPTILAWLGIPIAEDMDGRPGAFVAASETGTVPTHGAAPVARMELRPSGAEDEIVEQLKSLGYLE